MASTVDNRNGHYINNIDIGECNVCKILCTNRCDRCDELYCSIKCQREDWRTHKHVCFRMPNLILGRPIEPPIPVLRQNNNTSVYTNGKQNGYENGSRNDHDKRTVESNSSTKSSSSLTVQPKSEAKGFLHADEPKNNDDVILTWATKENPCYIRSVVSNKEYIKNAKDFHQHGQKGIKLLTVPQRNECVLVRHDGKFVRGIVLNASDKHNISVALADIGGKFKKTLSDFRKISDELIERKRYNFRIVLDDLSRGVGADQWNQLRTFVRDKTVFRIQFEGDTFTSGTNFKLIEKNSGSALGMLFRDVSLQTSAASKISKAKEIKECLVVARDSVESKMYLEHLKQPNKSIHPSKLKPQQESAASTKTFIKDFALGTLPESALGLKDASLPHSEASTSSEAMQVEEPLEISSEPKKYSEHLEEPKQSIDSSKLNPQLESAASTKTFIRDVTFKNLPEEVADILVLNTSAISSGCISVIEAENVGKLAELDEKIQKIAVDLTQEYEPDNNEICLAKFSENQNWYRARFTESEGMFHFIDYGNCESVQRKDVRSFPLSLRDPCFTVTCHIDDFSKMESEELIEKLKVFLSNRKLECRNIRSKIVGEGKAEVYITLPEIEELLKNN